METAAHDTEETVGASLPFSIPSFSGASIDPRLIDLGALLGILSSPSSTPSDQQTVHPEWFANVASNLSQIPQRAVPLLDLLRQLLGSFGQPEAVDAPGSAGAGTRSWYPILYDGAPTGFYVVVPTTTAASGNLVGIGFSKSYTEGPFIGHAYGVLPAFQLPNAASDVFVLGKTSSPIEIHLDVTQGPGTDVNGLRLTGLFTFSAKPTFQLQLLTSTTVQKTFATVQDIIDGNAIALLNRVIAVTACQNFLNKKLGSTTATLGTILGQTGLGFVSNAAGSYSVVDLTPFSGKSSLDFAMKVIKTILGAVASSSAPLIPVGTATAGQPAPGIYVHTDADGGGGANYGIRIVLPPVPLPLGSPGTDPTLTLRVGDWLSGESSGDTDTTWWSRAAVGTGAPAEPSPGVSIYLLNVGSTGSMKFTGILELASVGVDYEPAANQPLVKMGNFTLGGVEARGYVKLDFTGPQVVSAFGGALLVQKIGLPLGPSFGSAGGVISSVLAAGGSGDPQASQSVNPPFSVAAAFVSGSDKPYVVTLYDAAGKQGGPVWMPLQKTFGPIHIDKLGVGWTDADGGTPAKLELDVNGGVKLGPLAVNLIDLKIGLPPTNPLNPSGYSLGLDGMDISFENPPIKLEAGLAEVDGQYVGQASLAFTDFSIGAIGAYGTTGGAPSLFVFGWTNKAIGGPPYFYITALAAGFGYNRSLNLPPVSEVQKFPLLAAFADSQPFGGGSQLAQATTALTNLITGNYVPMTRGTYWLAAGVQFTSFQVVKTSALVAVEFGPDLTIAVLGVSTFQLGSNSNPYVYVELQLEASLRPADGVLMVQAELSANSYVFDPACHLTGGFAFGMWFGGPHEGDFVLTVGGYHPLFKPPAHYPVVPRLGFNWAVSGNVTIQGDAYFALTPGCVMAGGGLQASYHSGNLRAWVSCQADLLIQWRPFHFDANIQVSVGVSYKIHLLFINTTLTVELGAGLHLWGPPTGGTVYVDWYVISFSIDFGASNSDHDPILWGDFVTNLVPHQSAAALPTADVVTMRPNVVLSDIGAGPSLRSGRQNQQNDGRPNVQNDAAPASLTATAGIQPRIDVQLTGGKVRQDPTAGWIVRADGLAFTVRSSVPTRTAAFTGPSSSAMPHSAADFPMGIVPLGLSSVTSGMTVSITPQGTGKINGTFNHALNTQNVPTAVWGAAAATAPSATTMSLPVGLNVAADPYPAMGVPVIAITTLEYDVVDPKSGGQSGGDAGPAPLPLSPTAAIAQASAAESSTSLQTVANTIGDSSAKQRAQVLNAIADFGYGTGLTGVPAGLVSNLLVNLRAPIMLGSPAGVVWPPVSPS